MVSYLKLIHNGVLKTVALYDGIDPDELSVLLSTVFGVQSKIVGIMGEKGLVIPLSLLCKSPEVAPNSVCKILTVSLSKTSVPQQENGVNDNSSQQIGNSVTSDAAIVAEDHSQMVSDDDSVEYVTQEINRFLNGLKSQRALSPSQFRMLSHLLNENSNLLFAAYSVAISANDSEYFAEICKDLATSLETDQGRVACEAQDEVLQICDQLYINDKITENQLLYLRHLVLIREEAVATLYDEFQEHQSIPLLAKSLFELANTHPFQTTSTASNENETQDKGISFDTEDVPSSDEADEDDAEEVERDEAELKSPQIPKRKSSALIAKGLTGVISLMGRASLISKTELSILYELVEQENEYVFAAYELYEKNKNLEDLQDTLLRCAKLEIRKRVTDFQEKELAQMQQERELDKVADEACFSAENEVDDEDGEQNSQSTEDILESYDEISLEDISLATILQSLNIENLWEKSVPESFLKTVFIAAIRNQLTADQGKAICDLFHARYDLVHAAWEVFTVQRDAVDFVDTLRRVIRDVRVDEVKDPVDGSKARDSEVPRHSVGSPSSESPSEKAKADFDQDQMEQTLQDRKAEALLAVSAAKRELLKHSLEMMVKQKLTTSEKAQELYARYLSGDVLTDAAIEAYASDRDVGEFLDTLQVLANNSKEDLDILMRAVSVEKNEEQGEDPLATVQEDVALSQIEEIVNEMLKSDMIGPGIAEEFRKLIRARDGRLIEAYTVYQSNKSGAELVNSLLKIVIAAVESPSASSNKSSDEEAAVKESKNENTEIKPQASALDPEDQKTVVEILMRAKAIDSNQFDTLSKLIDQGDEDIKKVFLRYEENKDVYALIDALKTLRNPTSNSPKQVDEVGDDDDEDTQKYEEDIDEDDGLLIEEKFMQIIQNMRLSDLETAALRLAIAENDPSIRSAIDRFRSDLDEENLMNSMKDAARGVIQRTLASRMGQAFSRGATTATTADQNGEQVSPVDEVEGDEAKSNLGHPTISPKRSLLSPPKATGNSNYEEEFDEIEEIDEEDDTVDDDDDGDVEEGTTENEGGSLLLSQTARDHIFPILVQELIKENILSKADGRIVLQEFVAGNPVVSSALDVYDRDNDMAVLVESLQLLVENIRKA